ncbi:AEC family transporter [Neorickettsia risticii]|uniref:Auxin Efflux Carrier n=1 Tax=Neorickettsia risticii (strain Illinois) TaxID=434131 RepID=C6V445_NEORI|nr:AEC family transporter [Neorickettsia risticii]ACT69162.1 auxin Efflux Carrier [Neorickettsia risticii str. Illinois]
MVLGKIFPLYLMILLGYIAGRALNTDRNTIATLLLYLLSPLVILNGLLGVDNMQKLLLLPVIVFLTSCFMCWLVYTATKLFYNDSLRNIIAFSSGSFNTGQFGLPVALMIVDAETVGIYILAYSGIILFENTYGFYVASKGAFSPMYCIKKTLSLPPLHAIVVAFSMKLLCLHFPEFLDPFFANLRSTYVTLGMSTIGLGLGTIKRFEVDWKCIGITMFVKYFLWPVLMLSLVYLDASFLHVFDNNKVYNAMLILSVVPISVSTMLLGCVFNYPAEKVAVVVLISTLTGIVYIPLVVRFFF